MNESRPSSCPKIFISNELETSPFFYPIVNQALGQIRSWPVGRALLKAIAHSMPTVRGTGVRGFCVGANVTIHPLPDTVTFVRRNYRLPTDTADTMANNRNAFINLTQQNHFRETTANTLRMGGGNCHTALDQAAAGDGRGSATIIYFSNAIRAQQSVFVSAIHFVKLFLFNRGFKSVELRI